MVARIKSGEVDELFQYWKERTGKVRSQLDDRRKRLLRNALKLYGMSDCKRVVDGALKSPHHMGDNDRGKKYLNIELLFRNAEKIEQFLEYFYEPPKRWRRDNDEDENVRRIVENMNKEKRKWN